MYFEVKEIMTEKPILFISASSKRQAFKFADNFLLYNERHWKNHRMVQITKKKFDKFANRSYGIIYEDSPKAYLGYYLNRRYDGEN
jgi:hypothetical protein